MAALVNEEEKNMKVFVVVPRLRDPTWTASALKVVALEVSSDDTVASVKATLHDIEGIPPRRQRLVFARSALPDDDNTTLADHGVADSSTFQLVETKMQVFVRCLHSSTGSRTITLSGVESSDTVESFRVKLLQREDIGLRPAQQRLICGCRQLEDGHTLADYGVRDGTSITLLYRPAPLRRREVELDIEVTDTVKRIKERVEDALGVPVACQSVSYCGKDLDDGAALVDDEYGHALQWVHIMCERQEEGDDTTKTTKMVAETETVKIRADIWVTGLRKMIKKIIKQMAKKPVVQRRRLRVYLFGPELAAICPSSCDTDPAG